MNLQIVKNGSASITVHKEENEREEFIGIGNIDEIAFGEIVKGVADGIENDIMSILISSGAVAIGRAYLGFSKEEIADKKKPVSLAKRQACAAAGQALLMGKYISEFGKYGLKVAQILVTQDTFKPGNEAQKESLFKVFEVLLSQGVVLVINENDVLSSEEIQFSDNDKLAMLVAENITQIGKKVENVILLTDVVGLCDKNPKNGGKLVPRVTHIDETIYAMLDGTSDIGSGGMRSKIEVAERMMKIGIPVHVTYGKDPQVLQKIARGEPVGTVFAK